MKEKEISRDGVSDLAREIENSDALGMRIVTMPTQSARAALRYVEELERVGARHKGNDAAPMPTGEQQDERARFEAWAKPQSYWWNGQTYSDLHTQVAWEAWQARASLSSPSPMPAERQEAGKQPDGWEIVDPEAKVDRLRAATQALLNAALQHVAMGEDSALAKAVSEADEALAACVGWVAAPSSPSVSGTVDTQAFRKILLSIRDAKHALAVGARTETVIAHIDQHTAQAVRAAREEAIVEVAEEFNPASNIAIMERDAYRRILAMRTPQAAGNEQEGK